MPHCRDRTREFAEIRSSMRASWIPRPVGSAAQPAVSSPSRSNASGSKTPPLATSPSMKPIPTSPSASATSKMGDSGGISPLALALYGTLETHLPVIRNLLSELANLQSQRLRPHFKSDEAAEDTQIDLVSKKIKSALVEAERIIKQLALVHANTAAEVATLENMKLKMIRQVQQLSQQFKSQQCAFLTKLREQRDRITKQHMRTASSAARADLWDANESYDVAVQQKIQQYVAQGRSESEAETIALRERLFEEREQEIQKIYQQLVELHEMMKDMNALVIEQGGLLDTIEHNVDRTQELAKKGTKEVKKTLDNQSACVVM